MSSWNKIKIHTLNSNSEIIPSEVFLKELKDVDPILLEFEYKALPIKPPKDYKTPNYDKTKSIINKKLKARKS